MLRVRILLILSSIVFFLKNWRQFDFYGHFIKKFHIRKVKCLVRGGCQFGGWNQVTTGLCWGASMGPIRLWDSGWPSLKSIVTAPALTFVSLSMLPISVTIFLVCSPLFVWSLPFNLFGTGGPTRNTRLQPTCSSRVYWDTQTSLTGKGGDPFMSSPLYFAVL